MTPYVLRFGRQLTTSLSSLASINGNDKPEEKKE
jgi:hypothetical protein